MQTLTREAPAAVEELRRRGVRFDTRGGRQPGPRAGGRTFGAPDRSCRRRPDRARDHATAWRAGRRRATAVRVLEETSAARPLERRRPLCRAWSPTPGRSPPRATVLATGGGAALWRRTTNPWGAIGAGAVIAHAAGATLADLEFCQFHPTALALPGSEHDGTLLTEALRGEGAELLDASGRRFTDELAPRDQVTAAILRPDRGRRHRPRAARPALARAAALSERVRRLPRGGPGSRARAGPGGARGPLPDGRDRLRSRRAHLAAGPVRRRRVRLQRGPWRQPPGLELAHRMLRVRRPGGDRRRLGAAGERAAAACPSGASSRPTEATREAVWRRCRAATRRGTLEPLLDDPYPLARLIARAALGRRESRGPHRRADHPLRDPALDGVHLVIGPDGEPRPERWP